MFHKSFETNEWRLEIQNNRVEIDSVEKKAVEKERSNVFYVLSLLVLADQLKKNFSYDFMYLFKVWFEQQRYEPTFP